MGINNRYDGIDDFAVKCILFKSQALIGKAGLAESDIEDIQQKLILGLLRKIHKFNPQKGEWKAFVSAVVDQAAYSLIEKRLAQKRGSNTRITSLDDICRNLQEDPVHEIPDNRSARSFSEQQDLAMDLAWFLEKLPPDQRKLCLDLQTASITEIARRDKVSRQSIYRRKAQIKTEMEDGTS